MMRTRPDNVTVCVSVLSSAGDEWADEEQLAVISTPGKLCAVIGGCWSLACLWQYHYETLYGPIEMRLVSIDSLDHAKNIDTKFAIVSWTSCPPYCFSLKTYILELLLDRCSDFHKNRTVSSWDHADKKLWISSRGFQTIFIYRSNEFEAWCKTDSWSCISAMRWHKESLSPYFDHTTTIWSQRHQLVGCDESLNHYYYRHLWFLCHFAKICL